LAWATQRLFSQTPSLQATFFPSMTPHICPESTVESRVAHVLGVPWQRRPSPHGCVSLHALPAPAGVTHVSAEVQARPPAHCADSVQGSPTSGGGAHAPQLLVEMAQKPDWH
jgi:hypothetical protein